jgi:uncharacterized protein YuzE
MSTDEESGIKYITLKNGNVKKTQSIADEGTEILDKLGADIVLDFDEDDNLVGIELIGL